MHIKARGGSRWEKLQFVRYDENSQLDWSSLQRPLYSFRLFLKVAFRSATVPKSFYSKITADFVSYRLEIDMCRILYTLHIWFYVTKYGHCHPDEMKIRQDYMI